VIAAPSPPRCATRTAMMIAAYATAVITVQRNIRLPTPHRKVTTNTTMKVPEKIAAKVGIVSISCVALTSRLNEFSQPSVNQPLQSWGAVTPFKAQGAFHIVASSVEELSTSKGTPREPDSEELGLSISNLPHLRSSITKQSGRPAARARKPGAIAGGRRPCAGSACT
jgi:hypothetical protein